MKSRVLQWSHRLARRGSQWLLAPFCLILACCSACGATKPQPAHGSPRAGSIVDFERGLPCSDQGGVGFRKNDCERGKIVAGGAAGSAQSAIFRMDAKHFDLFLQREVRRKFLLSGGETLGEYRPNLLSFWVKLPSDSPLIGREEEVKSGDRVLGRKLNNGKSMTVMTYHWRPGDLGVGGPSNRGLMTDSNMHGYSEFRFTDRAAGQWVKVSLSPSAFRLSRNYFHFYAASAVTDDLDLFASLRQLQFRVEAKLPQPTELQLDEISLEYQPPTVRFREGFHAARVPAKGGDHAVPVVISNPSERQRRYRVFISSFLGVDRQLLNQVAAATDDLVPMRGMQEKAGGDGGLGVAELVGQDGTPVSRKFREIVLPPGGVWQGKLVHHVKPEMLSKELLYHYRDYEFPVRRDTLTTSVIVWDPEDPVNRQMEYLATLPHNSDDARHGVPPGFPKQARPPEGWRSEEIPYNQVGGYFVSVLTLTD